MSDWAAKVRLGSMFLLASLLTSLTRRQFITDKDAARVYRDVLLQKLQYTTHYADIRYCETHLCDYIYGSLYYSKR